MEPAVCDKERDHFSGAGQSRHRLTIGIAGVLGGGSQSRDSTYATYVLKQEKPQSGVAQSGLPFAAPHGIRPPSLQPFLDKKWRPSYDLARFARSKPQIHQFLSV